MQSRVGKRGRRVFGNVRSRLPNQPTQTAQAVPDTFTSTIGNLQPTGNVVKKGFEAPGSGTIVTSTGFNLFQVPINPAEPGTFPGLSQTANQFMHFNVNELVLMWRPSATTQTAGSIAFCLWPAKKEAANQPTTWTDFISQQGIQTALTWGNAQQFQFDASCYQTMFRSFMSDIEKDADVASTDKTCAMLCIGYDNFDEGISIGSYGLSYNFSFWGNRLKPNSTALRSRYEGTATGGTRFETTIDDLVEGHHQLIRRDDLGGGNEVYEIRCSSAATVVSLSGSHTASPFNLLSSLDGYTFTAALTPLRDVDATTSSLKMYVLPAGTRYITPIFNGTALTDYAIDVCSVRS